MSTQEPIRILLAEDHVVSREGFRVLLEQDPQLRIVCEANNGEEAVALYEAFRPDIALLDLAMPEIDGLEAIKQIKSLDAQSRIIILTGDEDLGQVWVALDFGACGFLSKEIDHHALRWQIKLAARGFPVFSPGILECFIQVYKEKYAPLKQVSQELMELTKREREVLVYILRRYSSRQIGANMGLSSRTVEKHWRNCLRKLGCTSREELFSLATARGFWGLPV
ncbi:response regulator [Desulfohalobium retbaense]|uniref:Two component transcriptional regulator, LuxR family n=1 Tax=Desulfohalobium retbaense (strain ATCC 49708 / DSM 5692 / JCM 16813 / HR100) TaxID=485915 RepID=C8X116_DESRD|nr:response regulator transcription factor [Desulfohalobium retbaense]ACV68113.1 two component transcriptional regulator, LuxR family [Desulfohalobium retbaense DSM 5692]